MYPLFTPAFQVRYLTSTSASYLMKASVRIVWTSDTKSEALCYGEATVRRGERQDVHQTTFRTHSLHLDGDDGKLLKHIYSKSGLMCMICSMITVRPKLVVHWRSLRCVLYIYIKKKPCCFELGLRLTIRCDFHPAGMEDCSHNGY